jgi:uncharacterized membrane protein YccF (DUF307 family)
VGYERLLDYDQPPPPPPFAADDVAWINGRITATNEAKARIAKVVKWRDGIITSLLCHSAPLFQIRREKMSILGNVIWLIFGGLIAALGYIIGGLALCLTIIGIPFGMQSIRIGFATLTPFGKEVIEQPGGDSRLSLIF